MAETQLSTIHPVVPVPGGVVFPGTVATLALGDPNLKAAVEAARSAGVGVLLVPEVPERTATVGVLAAIDQVGELPNGEHAAIVRGQERARLGAAVVSERAGLWVEATPVADARPTPRVDALGRELRDVLAQLGQLRSSRRLPEILRNVGEPGALADAATAWADRPAEEQLDVLEAVDLPTRLTLVLGWARDLLAETEVGRHVRDEVTENLQRQQREMLLRQQLAAIRKELGEGDGDPASDYRARIADLPLPEKVHTQVVAELDRLDRTSSQSPESGWIRTWLDRVLDLPWGVTTEDVMDLDAARAVLDADHTGLDDVKDRIIEVLAVRKLRHERGRDATPAGGGRGGGGGGGAIVVLVGPPGVGKTSLGESIARSMGRKFVRVALGGIRDEAEIRGHRRTYVGSQPGRIVRAVTEAGSINPVVLLDEVDKLSAGGWSGDPTAALLEVLDPAQNHTFRDHYLEVELDLSQVLFLATANVLETIPGPLLDRMEVVRLDGYTEDEKVAIALGHLLPRQIERVGLRPNEVVLTEAAVRGIATGYTREAGVRSLERELGRLLRKLATRVASNPEQTSITVDVEDLPGLLGRQKVDDTPATRLHVPGVATGLAVTGTGGDVLAIEASASDGEAGLLLTGQLGDVMKESAQIALSHVRSNAARLGIPASSLNRRFHLHVPAGAVPKDGPSAGITMATAIASLLTDRPVRSEVGMTGELTLQGRVLPIGGVKQKVLAAHRAGLTEVVLPKRNGPDLEDVPERVREVMTFHLAESLDEVLAVALGEPTAGTLSEAA